MSSKSLKKLVLIGAVASLAVPAFSQAESAQFDHFSSTHRVICVDLAGHGGSGQGREAWTMAAFGGDVKAVVEQEGLDDVVLIGHSMGGAVIAEAALLMPERVRGFVGVDNFQQITVGLTDEQIAGAVTFNRLLEECLAEFTGPAQ